MKTYLKSVGIAPCVLDLSTRWRQVVSFMPRPFYPQGKSPWYPLYTRLGGPQSQSGHSGEEKNSQPLVGLEPPDRDNFTLLLQLNLQVVELQVNKQLLKELHHQINLLTTSSVRPAV